MININFKNSSCVCGARVRPSYLLPTQRAVFLVDAPTSRAKIPLAALQAIHDLTTKQESFSVAVHCGGRLDFLAACQAKMQALWPTAGIFVSLVNNGGEAQSNRRKSKFALVMHRGKQQTAIPSFIPAFRGKAKSYEGLRLRCLSLRCPHRSEEERAKAENFKLQAATDPSMAASLTRCEISAEDDEDRLDDNEDAQSEEECDAFIDPLGSPDVRDFITDVFSFSRSTSFYLVSLSQLLAAESSVVTVVFSGTTHPSAAIAARTLGQEVFLVTNAAEHSLKHGLALEESIWINRFLEARGRVYGSMWPMFFV